MRKSVVALGTVLLGIALAHSGSARNAFTADQIQFGPAPPFLQPGAQLAVLEGDSGCKFR